MGDELRFDGRVVIVTGAGAGLGRSHALLFASRGAKVVVNDLGGKMTGGGQSTAAADAVVQEIKAQGGQAVANYDSVENGAQIVQCALDHYKQVDVVINNAGILRDASFKKMTEEDWDLINRVHVLGAFRVTHAAWPHMQDKSYGRILFTISSAGLYGNFGQANYAAAKLGLLGLSNTLALEGAKKNIKVNAIAPFAGSRLTETVLQRDMLEALEPGHVSPVVAWLAHESCESTGGCFEVGGGVFTQLRWERTQGKVFKLGRTISPEAVRGAWEQITDFSHATHPENIAASMAPIVSNLGTKSLGGNELIDVDQALGAKLPETVTSYTEKDLALYALGVGAARDPLDANDLKLVFELNSEGFYGLPTYGVVPAINAILKLAMEGHQAPGLNYGFDRILHGEQFTEVTRPLPAKATLRHKARIKDIFDKGKGAVVVTEIVSEDAETGEVLIRNDATMFVRGAGGFGGERGPSSEVNVPPDRKPDAVITEKTADNQALLYRLTGDWNPLHADPAFAQAFGFEKPILHGLCTFGYVGRHVIKAFAGGDPRLFRNIRVRFADTVFPGETLKTEMWKEKDGKIVFRTSVVEREKVVISNASVELYPEIPTARPVAKAAPAAAAPAPASSAGRTSADVFAVIAAWVAEHPEVAAKVNTTYQLNLTSPSSTWTIDMRGKGQVGPGAPSKADCVLNLSDADWLAMTGGQADPQKLYFGGKLKITGNVMASQKLEFLKQIDPSSVKVPRSEKPAAAPVAKAQEPAAEPKARAIFTALAERVAKTPSLVTEVKAVLRFKVSAPDAVWTVDLKNGDGSVVEGATGKPDATLALSDADLVELAKDVSSVPSLFMHGALRVDGDLSVAHRLGFMKQLIS